MNLESKIKNSNEKLIPKEGQLVFDSNFESGNLLEARK